MDEMNIYDNYYDERYDDYSNYDRRYYEELDWERQYDRLYTDINDTRTIVDELGDEVPEFIKTKASDILDYAEQEMIDFNEYQTSTERKMKDMEQLYRKEIYEEKKKINSTNNDEQKDSNSKEEIPRRNDDRRELEEKDAAENGNGVYKELLQDYKELVQTNQKIMQELINEKIARQNELDNTVRIEKGLLERVKSLGKSAKAGVYVALHSPLHKIHCAAMNQGIKSAEKRYKKIQKKYEKLEKKLKEKATKRYEKDIYAKSVEDMYKPSELYRLDMLKYEMQKAANRFEEACEKKSISEEKYQKSKKYMKEHFKEFLGKGDRYLVKREDIIRVPYEKENSKHKEILKQMKELQNQIADEKPDESRKSRLEGNGSKEELEEQRNRLNRENERKEKPERWTSGRLSSGQEIAYKYYKKNFPQMYLNPRELAYIPEQKLPYVLEINSYLEKNEQDIDKIARLSGPDLWELKEKSIQIPDKYLKNVINEKVESDSFLSVEDALKIVKQKEQQTIESKKQQYKNQDEKVLQGFTKGKLALYQEFKSKHPKMILEPSLLKDVKQEDMKAVMYILSKTNRKNRTEEYVKDIISMSSEQIKDYAKELKSKEREKQKNKESTKKQEQKPEKKQTENKPKREKETKQSTPESSSKKDTEEFRRNEDTTDYSFLDDTFINLDDFGKEKEQEPRDVKKNDIERKEESKEIKGDDDGAR